MANPVAVPGSVVPVGANVAPGGAQGIQGVPGPVSPLATTSAPGLINKLSGNATDFLTGQNAFANVAAAVPRDAYYPTSVGGTVNAITLTHLPACPAPQTGYTFSFPASGLNTGAVTVSVDGSTAYALVDQTGAALIGGELSGICTMVFAGSSFVLTSTRGGNSPVSFPAAATLSGQLVNPALNTMVAVSNLAPSMLRGPASAFNFSGGNFSSSRDAIIAVTAQADRAVEYLQLSIGTPHGWGFIQGWTDTGVVHAGYISICCPILANTGYNVYGGTGTACNINFYGYIMQFR